MTYLTLLLFLVFPLASFSEDTGCDEWFLKTGAEPGTKDCETKCAASMVAMDTFSCPNQCESLCSAYLDRLTVDQLTCPYTLTEAEKKLIQKYPKEAVLVFFSKYLSEKATRRVFGAIPKHNNEADAFRHYVWAGRLAHTIGEEKARLFLEAHESNSDDAKEEKDMDRHNNEKGVKHAADLDRSHQFSSEKLEKSALDSLRNKTLKVLRPTQLIPEWK